MATSTRIFCGVTAAIFLCAAGSGTPIRPVTLDELVQRSDVVVTGHVTAVTTQGRTTVHTVGGLPVQGQVYTAKIAVEQVLKGPDDLSVLECEFVLPDAAIGFRGVGASTDAMVFLVTKNNRYQFTNPYYPALSVVPLNEVRGVEPMDRVIGALSAVLDSPAATVQAKSEILALLPTASAPAARATLRNMLTRSDRRLRLPAAAALIQVDDADGIKVAEDALLNPINSDEPHLTNDLRAALGASKIKNPSAIPSLSRLLGAEDVETRRVAASALRRTGLPGAISPLILALSDSDIDVQYSAVMGLSEITGKLSGAPSVALFRKDPEPFVTYWRNWARTR